MPYDDAALARMGDDRERKPDQSDLRTRFARDRDRIIYSTAFRRLASKTQVVAADEFGLYHTRLTHSLKVAQLGRRLAERLRARHLDGRVWVDSEEIAPCDPDLVEAACLAHDLGHPPFGHVGEESLCETFDELASQARRFPRKLIDGGDDRGGFEGNAQTFRVLTYLSARLPLGYGLDLTRATLDAASKYPWARGAHPKPKWCAYDLDQERLQWVRADLDLAPSPSAPDCFEMKLMDWCDDVTYAVHDVIDFYRGGEIQLDRLLAVKGALKDEVPDLSDEALYFLEEEIPALHPAWNIDDAKVAWRDLAEMSQIAEPWRPVGRVKAMCQDATSQFITYFTSGVGWEGDAPCRFDGTFRVESSSDELEARKTYGCALLKELIRAKVIERSALASQQAGARKIVGTLLRESYTNPSLLPPDRKEEADEHGDLLRAATDHVASLTERDAVALYRRISGVDLGSLSDPL